MTAPDLTCCLCLKRIEPTSDYRQAPQRMALGQWAHAECFRERYHPEQRSEPAEKQAGMVLEEMQA